jgi:uncharacterized repeat protein (TIGR03803 family)
MLHGKIEHKETGMSTSRVSRFALSCCAGAVVLAGCGGSASLSPPPTGLTIPAQRARSNVAYKLLYSFRPSGDGANPYAGLLKVGSMLYGTTAYGGTNGDGAIFSIAPSDKEMVLHNFGAAGDGSIPFAGLINVQGTLYGTTSEGGVYCGPSGGCGTVFSITQSGTEVVLHSFGGSGDGANPLAGLINFKGALYGTTYRGGANGDGAVFSITPSRKEAVLYNFKGGSADGEFPLASLVTIKGKLFGTTVYGGANDEGTVFSITRSGKESVRHSFGGSGDGERPYAGLIAANGTLYGTTHLGGADSYGAVFSITPSGKEAVLYSFKGGSADGEYPYAGLIDVKGSLYGTTIEGGENGAGTVFSIAPPTTEIVLHSFGGAGDGEYPYYGALIDVKGRLYGTTYDGGANGDGTVFSLKP